MIWVKAFYNNISVFGLEHILRARIVGMAELCVCTDPRAAITQIGHFNEVEAHEQAFKKLAEMFCFAIKPN